MALLTMAFAFHARQPGDALGADAARAAAGGAPVGRLTSAAPACAVGADCSALIPYRETGPWTASCEWFVSRDAPAQRRAESVSLDGSEPENMGRDPANWCLPAGPARPPIRFLFVTLPDPVTTHLALYFDRTIETVQAALQQAGFYLDRYYLPWSLPGGTPAAGDTSQDLRVNTILERFRLKQPGVMIFTGPPDGGSTGDSRAPATPPCVMYVFLVSESPISGINKTQFQNAVAYARVLSDSPSPPLHVVGPFFSGSVPSVIDLAADLRRQEAMPDFASGTVTSRQQSRALSTARISFRPTLHDDDTAEEFLLGFLEDRGLTPDGRNVAILQEDETRYGGDKGSAGDGNSDRFPRVRHITFPRELSRLRNASADSFGAAPAGPAAGDLTPPTQGVSWNWKDTSKDEDAVPSFSGQQEPLSQQAVLLSIADTIRQENIKYVGIAATDIFDILFLSKFLKIAAPNTRLFVLDADLLMVRTSDAGRELSGTLAVTTYPLFARNADWTQLAADPRGFQTSVDIFPSRIALGVYNAVLLQLNQGGLLTAREYSNPLLTSGSNDRPALWLTMVGRTGFWPVALRDNLDAATQAAPAPWRPAPPAGDVRERLQFDPPDGTTLFLHGLLFVWGVIHLLGMWIAPDRGNRWLGQFQVDRRGRRIHTQYRAYYLICGSLALSAMLMLIVISFLWLWRQGGIAFNHPWLYDTLYTAIGLVGTGLLIGAWRVARPRVSKAVAPLVAGFPWALYGASIIVWVYLNAGRGTDGLFFAQRAFYLGDGVSPLLPVELLLLLYYVWSWIFIRKVRLSESKQVRIPDPELLGPGGSGLRHCVADLERATDNIVFNRGMAPWILGGCVATFFFLLRPWAALHSVEGKLYDAFVVFLVFFICLLIVLTWGRYLYIWSRLRQILRGLERTPLRKAFDRFPKTYSWSPLWYEDAGRRAYTISARSVECFQALARCEGTATVPQFVAQVDDMVRAFRHVIQSDTADPEGGERSGAVRALQKIFLVTATQLLDDGMRKRWAEDGGSDTLDAAAADAAAADAGAAHAAAARPPVRELLAEEFVALRYVGLIHYESAQMKNLVVLLSVGFILALAAIASYPFLAGRECVWSLAAVFVVFGAGIIATFAQMDRDAILSRLSRSDPGKLDLSFYLRVASYGALPLLALMASQFPSIGRFLFSWLEPALNALH